MNVLEVLDLATQAAQAASKAYDRSVAIAQEVEQASVRQADATTQLLTVTKARSDAEAAVKQAYQWLSQQVKALSLASPKAVQAAHVNLETQRAALAEAEQLVVTARESSKNARARTDQAVALAEHAARIRDAINAASDVTNASANFGGTKEAAYTHAKLLEARTAATETANNAAMQAAKSSQEADMVDSITMAAEVKTDTARGAVTAAETALSMAQSAHVVVVQAVETLNQQLGNE